MTRIELADAMLRGLHTQNVEESKTDYIHVFPLVGICKACALGCAIIGKYGGDYVKAEDEADYLFNINPDAFEVELAAEILDIPRNLAIEIEHKHLNDMPIEQIAAWLKSEEVEVKTI